jgi:uncharacterized protein
MSGCKVPRRSASRSMSTAGRESDTRWHREASFRFYEELNDFLPAERRQADFTRRFDGTPAVKDVIEAIGVPHTEVDLILVDGESVGFDYRLRGGERIAVYPTFERLDIGGVTRLRPQPLREPRFILDVHLGKLARYLRLIGFDVAYGNDLSDAVIAARSVRETRILLTRDRGLLKRSEVTHGYWLRSTVPRAQLVEVVRALDLTARMHPFSRCLECNSVLATRPESEVRDELPERVRGRYATIARCPGCGRLYWPGSHHARLAALVASLVDEPGADA